MVSRITDIFNSYLQYRPIEEVKCTHELIHHVTQGEEKKWELGTTLLLACEPSSAEHTLNFMYTTAENQFSEHIESEGIRITEVNKILINIYNLQ